MKVRAKGEKRPKINDTTMIEEIRSRTDYSKEAIETILNVLFSRIVEHARVGDRVVFKDFGVFKKTLNKAKIIKGPRQRDDIIVNESGRLLFRQTSIIKSLLIHNEEVRDLKNNK